MEVDMRESWQDKLFHQKFMKELGYKPRRRKASHQWWESPFIDYDTPLQKYYYLKRVKCPYNIITIQL